MGSKELSSDIIYDILTRTKSLKTLDICKCICKEWKQITYESSFMPLYCKRSNNLSGYYIQGIRFGHIYLSKFICFEQSLKDYNCAFGNLPSDVKILASCNQGILCCVKRTVRGDRYFAIKPATDQWQSLPSPKLRNRTIGVAIVVVSSSLFRYKIVRLYQPHDVGHNKIICEIFDSNLWKWRETQGTQFSPNEFILGHNPAISIGNRIHWLINKNDVLTFDESNHSFNKFSSPNSFSKNELNQLVDYEGRLGFVCLTDDDDLELWQKESTENDLWTKKMAVKIKGLGQDLKYACAIGFYNAEIVFVKLYDKVVFYKLQDCSFFEVELDYSLRHANEIFQFRSDFEPVNLKGGV
ncbi:hypothetical protein CDL12_25840 [Handroanthus impetiginosus]|uniref:F-box associated beta-propeller type 3 domain-containing protein n=1 Tax=Handroanthus impetiginosus TaxID=429701 RepID=A0A2G9G8P8_9LAMI|nr:hypothetical protein CDL12_25840 [Handroanthus impetiginosus]